MAKEFQIIGRDGTPPRSGQFYDLTIHPSVQGFPAKTVESFVGMNASIRTNHERLGSVYAEHLINSKTAILTTADRALSRVPDGKKKKALILGAGNCLDIPLAELADRFDEVKLVEVDHESTQRAVRELSLDRQRKIEIVAADVTGIVGELAGKIQHEMRSPLQPFLGNAAKRVGEIEVSEKAPDLGDNYTFVCSQLIMTQLASLPHDYLYSAVRERYGVNLSSMPGGADHELFMNLQKLTLDLQQEHIKQLARFADAEGTVHLADTYAKVLPVPGSTQPQILPMVLANLIDPVINQEFTIVPQEPDFWLWDNMPGTYKFAVLAKSLDPKTKEGII